MSLRMFIVQVLASQLSFLANRNAELAVPPLFWSVNCIKIGGHVALLSGLFIPYRPLAVTSHIPLLSAILEDKPCCVKCQQMQKARLSTVAIQK